MKQLPKIEASPEQLSIVSSNALGVEVICGAAGSGKTTTAILRLRSLSSLMRARKSRIGDKTPVKVLVLTFNRTLAGYVEALAQNELSLVHHQIEIDTFAGWARGKLGDRTIHDVECRRKLRELATKSGLLDSNYLVSEVEYLLGRFELANLENYVTTERTGRGSLPRVSREVRRKLLDDVVYPYLRFINENSKLDWNKLALNMITDIPKILYDVIIVDESQDFSANQIRAIMFHASNPHAITFVIDTVQRVYARGFTWSEAGVVVSPNRSHRLKINHRNTKQIAQFARGILSGMPVDDNGTLPDLNAAQSDGQLPIVLKGKYSEQVAWCMKYIKKHVDLTSDSVAFLKPKGGKWFSTISAALRKKGCEFVDLTRLKEWPAGDENVAISTFHSAKGLEFDHVFIIGLSDENAGFCEEERSDEVRVLRNLLAVAVARARKTVVVGYKPGEESGLIGYFNKGTYSEIVL